MSGALAGCHRFKGSKVLVENYLRQQFRVPGQGKAARELVEGHLERAVIAEDAVEIQLFARESDQSEGEGIARLPWTKQPSIAVKGAIQEVGGTQTDPRSRVNLLTTIGKAMVWMEELTAGATLAEIAHRERKGERQIRLLLPLAFTSPPATVRSILNDTGHFNTVAELTKNVPLQWSALS